MEENKKAVKYTSLGDNHLFTPLAFETFGIWGKEAGKILSAIGGRIGDQPGDLHSVDYLRQRISVELQRGNATSVLETLRDQKCLEIFFIVILKRFLLGFCCNPRTLSKTCLLSKLQLLIL